MRHRAIIGICATRSGRLHTRIPFGPWALLTLLALLLAAPPGARAQADGAIVTAPPLQAYVNDFTTTLTPAQRQLLEFDLADFEQRTGVPIAVLIVATTRPETIEQYSIRVADQWGIGRNEIDDKRDDERDDERDHARTRDGHAPAGGAARGSDGILIVVAKGDRRVRLELGAALQRTIPDVRARFIVDETITPRFRTGDYAGGLHVAVDELLHQIGHERLAAGTGPARASPSGQAGPSAAHPAVSNASFTVRVPSAVSALAPHWPPRSVEWPLWWMASFLAGLLLRCLVGRLSGSALGAVLSSATLALGSAPPWLAAAGGVLLFFVLLTMAPADFPMRQTSRHTWRSGRSALPGNWHGGFGIGGLGGNGSGFGGGGASGRW